MGMDQPGSAADDGARLYRAVNKLIAADNQREAQRVVDTFQTKVVKSLENTLRLTGCRRSGPGQARDLYDRALGL